VPEEEPVEVCEEEKATPLLSTNETEEEVDEDICLCPIDTQADFVCDGPDFDRHTPGFNKQWHDRVVRDKKKDAEKNGREYVPEVDNKGNEVQHTFNYGDFVA
jgi:hypothetical protein